MLGEVIWESKHKFVEGRQILDVVMVVNELMDDLVGNKRKGVLCKLNIEEVYNHVIWEFVDYMLGRLGSGRNGGGG